MLHRVLGIAASVGFAACIGSHAPQAVASTHDYSSFQTPSHNIFCAIDSGSIRCDLQEFTFEPPPRPTSNCYGAWGRSIGMNVGGQPSFRCISDWVGKQDAPVLQYGDQARHGSLLCASHEDGLVCSDVSTGRGFRIAKESYAFLP